MGAVVACLSNGAVLFWREAWSLAARLYGGPCAELATAIAPELKQLGAGYYVYLLCAPWMYADFPTLAYLAPSIEMIDLPEELTVASLEAVVPAGRSLAFVVSRSGRTISPCSRRHSREAMSRAFSARQITGSSPLSTSSLSNCAPGSSA